MYVESAIISHGLQSDLDQLFLIGTMFWMLNILFWYDPLFQANLIDHKRHFFILAFDSLVAAWKPTKISYHKIVTNS